MNDRPTPETNGRIIRQFPRMCGCRYDSEIVYADFARRLERERDEARAETKRIRDFMDTGFARAKEELDDTRNLLREIFNLTQIGDPHPADLPMKALAAIAEMIDEQLTKKQRATA